MERYSAIKDMYYGRRGDGQLIEPNEEYHEQAKKQFEIVDKLKDDKEGQDLVEEFFWASAGVEAAAVEQHYQEGFSFGVLMGLEIAGMR